MKRIGLGLRGQSGQKTDQDGNTHHQKGADKRHDDKGLVSDFGDEFAGYDESKLFHV